MPSTSIQCRGIERSACGLSEGIEEDSIARCVKGMVPKRGRLFKHHVRCVHSTARLKSIPISLVSLALSAVAGVPSIIFIIAMITRALPHYSSGILQPDSHHNLEFLVLFHFVVLEQSLQNRRTVQGSSMKSTTLVAAQ